jgi:hypothetical protein
MKGIDKKKIAPKAGGGGGGGTLLASILAKIMGGSSLYSAWSTKDRSKKKKGSKKVKESKNYMKDLVKKYPQIKDDPEWIKFKKKYK